MKKYIIIVIAIVTTACADFMDVIPDNIATIDHIFANRVQAENYLLTCYTYLPEYATANEPGMALGDAIWYHKEVNAWPQTWWDLMRFGNNVTSPYYNYWGGRYVGIRVCNNFLENVDKATDVNSIEKARWTAEAKFIKAFHHFWLLQMYGPIPIVRENLPINVSTEEISVYRDPVDDVVDYIVQLIDEAVPDLPRRIDSEASELGRITQPIALSVKAKVLVTAASPLFNGNTAYAQFKDKKGRVLFNQDTSAETKRRKWERAATACKNAIDTCKLAGHRLYEFSGNNLPISDDTKSVVQCSQIVTDKWNTEHIWGKSFGGARINPTNGFSLQAITMPRLHSDHQYAVFPVFVPTLKVAEMFYTKNGVPIDEDKEYDYAGRYELQTLEASDTYHRYLLQPNRETAKLHQNREHRFYGSMGVDGGWWFGVGRNDDMNQWPLNFKYSQMEGGQIGTERYSVTGFYIKKLASYLNTYSGQTIVPIRYDWPIFRLADLYLLCAEALNECLNDGEVPSDEVYYWIDEVRMRAGLDKVVPSWEKFSLYPERCKTKEGMRRIIQQERNIELAFEAHRFWDLRRWGLAMEYFTQPIQGWDVSGRTNEDFYQVVHLDNIKYTLRDIFWPIHEGELRTNRNLVQNPGW